MKKINKGDLLVSMPEILDDAVFNRSVICITEINNDSVIGFVINKCHQFDLTDIDKRISEHKIKIYDGGPLSKEKIYLMVVLMSKDCNLRSYFSAKRERRH